MPRYMLPTYVESGRVAYVPPPEPSYAGRAPNLKDLIAARTYEQDQSALARLYADPKEAQKPLSDQLMDEATVLARVDPNLAVGLYNRLTSSIKNLQTAQNVAAEAEANRAKAMTANLGATTSLVESIHSQADLDRARRLYPQWIPPSMPTTYGPDFERYVERWKQTATPFEKLARLQIDERAKAQQIRASQVRTAAAVQKEADNHALAVQKLHQGGVGGSKPSVTPAEGAVKTLAVSAMAMTGVERYVSSGPFPSQTPDPAYVQLATTAYAHAYEDYSDALADLSKKPTPFPTILQRTLRTYTSAYKRQLADLGITSKTAPAEMPAFDDRYLNPAYKAPKPVTPPAGPGIGGFIRGLFTGHTESDEVPLNGTAGP